MFLGKSHQTGFGEIGIGEQNPFENNFQRKRKPTFVESHCFERSSCQRYYSQRLYQRSSPKFEIFEDRIEITSAGGLPDALTQEEFFDGVSIPRNKELMRIFKDLDMVEQLGFGRAQNFGKLW